MKSVRGRQAYTLLELMVSMALATLLIAGLASSLFIANAAFDVSRSTSLQRSQAAEAGNEMMVDLNVALSFSERTATAVTFQVPDRDDDEVPETIRYAWSGNPGDPLTVEHNGSPPAVIAEDVHDLEFSYLTRDIPGGGGP